MRASRTPTLTLGGPPQNPGVEVRLPCGRHVPAASSGIDTETHPAKSLPFALFFLRRRLMTGICLRLPSLRRARTRFVRFAVSGCGRRDARAADESKRKTHVAEAW